MSKIQVEQMGAGAAGGVPVGTIVTNIAQDLGEKYLPCDGRAVSAVEYPELNAMLPPAPEFTSGWVNRADQNGFEVAFINGYWFRAANSVRNAVRYATSPCVPMDKPLAGPKTSGRFSFSGDGIWFTDNKDVYRMKKPPFGEWEKIADLGTSQDDVKLFSAGGYLFIGAWKSGNNRKMLCKNEDDPNGEITDISGSFAALSANDEINVLYLNGNFVFVRKADGSDYASVKVCTGGNPLGEWSDSPFKPYGAGRNLNYFDGKYFEVAFKRGGGFRIYYSESLLGPVEEVVFGSAWSDASVYVMADVMDGKVYFLSGYFAGTIDLTADPSEWANTATFYNTKSLNLSSVYDVCAADGLIVLIGSYTTYHPVWPTIPLLTSENGNQFIKAKV